LVEISENNKVFLKPGKIVSRLFWSVILCFLLIFITVLYIGSPIGPYSAAQFAGTLYFPFIIIFLVFSVSIVFLVYSIRERLDKLFKSFLILTGASASGFSDYFKYCFCNFYWISFPGRFYYWNDCKHNTFYNSQK